MSDDWRTDPRAVQPELTPGYPHATWPQPATRWPTIAEKLDAATNAQLIALTRSGIGEPIA